MKLQVTPDMGHWQGGTWDFTIAVPPEYPHKPPKVTCDTKIYHPNIDLAGAVCLNILRADWKPVFDLNTVVSGITFLFYEPNPEDPLNKGTYHSLLCTLFIVLPLCRCGCTSYFRLF